VGGNWSRSRGHGSIWSVAFSSDGHRIVTGNWDCTASVWEAASGRELLTFKGHSGYVRSVAFSPDGQRIVTASEDLTAKVWETTSGLAADKLGGNLLALEGHSGPISSVAFSPDGQRIVTGSADQTAKVWDAAKRSGTVHAEGSHRFDSFCCLFPRRAADCDRQ